MPLPSNKILCINLPTPIWEDYPDYYILKSIDLWRISIKDTIHKMDDLTKSLSEEELKRAERYHQQKDKIRFTIGKGMLRELLARYLKCLPESIQFKKGFNNKPYIEGQAIFHFNVSYSNNWIIIAVSSEAIGVDIEYVNSTFHYLEIADDVFMNEEKSFLFSSSKPHQEFFKLWTRKEALLKATSRGLDDHLRDFSCLDGLQPLSRLSGFDADWKIKSFLMEEEYFVSLAYQDTKPIRYCNNNDHYRFR